MRKTRAILSVLLTLCMVLTLLPMASTTAYAWDSDCAFCGAGRSDDYLCDNCGGCGGVIEGCTCWTEHHCEDCGMCEDMVENHCEDCGMCGESGDYQENHCPECSVCLETAEAFCTDCWRCTDCAKTCPDCLKCFDCGAYGIEFNCESCEKCAACITDGVCSECGNCGDCVTEFCGEEDHSHCIDCTEYCEECLRCSDSWPVPGLKCDSCDKCCACLTPPLCVSCGSCGDCVSDFCANASEDSGPHCSDCEDLCPDCSWCADCLGTPLCSTCGTCKGCTGDKQCEDCETCGNCATICDECGAYCSDCTILCEDCGKCANCVALCVSCDVHCGDCVTLCGGCSTCEECTNGICATCREHCNECDVICPDCNEICSQCDDTCENCHKCSSCATLCSNCSEVCADCAELCDNCGVCENCTTLCSKNGDYCHECYAEDAFCQTCDGCENCVELCPGCATVCSECESFCPDCGLCNEDPAHNWCESCDECMEAPSHMICSGCGDHRVNLEYATIDENCHGMRCSCGLIQEDAQEHCYGYRVVQEPTEDEAGEGEYYCYDCGYVPEEKVVIPATGGEEHVHDYSMWAARSTAHYPRCICGAELAANWTYHTFHWIEDKPATTTTMGIKHEECTVCAYKKAPVSIPAIGHTCSFSSQWSKDERKHWHGCSCGAKNAEAAHGFGSWAVTVAPTETTAGSKERTCTVCQHKQTVVLPATAAQLTVSFDVAGGSAVADQSVKAGNEIIKPADPTRQGYAFVGWYGDSAYSSKWNFSHPIFEAKQLYAKWTVNLAGPPTIITEALSDGIKGISYEEALVATGSAPFTFTLESGALPDGLSLSTDGKITGTPTQEGTFSFTVKAANGQHPDATKDFSIKIEVKHLVTVNGGTGGGYYKPGDTVTLSAGTKPGYTFKGWTSSDVTIADPSGKTISFTMPDKAVAVTANWRYNGGGGGSSYSYYTITASAGANGTISPSGDLTIREGWDKTFTITADSGYVVDDVLVDGKSVGSVKTYTFEDVSKSHTIKATFVKAGQTNPQTGVDLPFEDVKESDWFYESVKYVFDKGLMAGIGETTFAPNITTTRGMIVTVLHRMEGSPAVTGANPFDDVAAGEWYAEAIKWAAENELVGGYGDGKFGPEDSTTREQLAAILMNYAKHKGYDVSGKADLSKFSDADKISDWATAPLAWATAKGLISGTGGGILDPKDEATRAQVAAILMRFCESYK